MPTKNQHGLFTNLRACFGHLDDWKALTKGHNFDAMSDHAAMHYLGMILAAFPALRIAAPCQCGKPVDVYAFAKSPTGGQPGRSSDPRP